MLLTPTSAPPSPPSPPWIEALVETVFEAMVPLSFMGPLGWRWWEPGQRHNPYGVGWCVAVYPTAFEIMQGAADGAKGLSGFRLDLGAIVRAFAPLLDCHWHAPARGDQLLDSPSVIFRGLFAGKQVQLQICQWPPEDEPAACRVNTQTNEITRLESTHEQ